MTTSGITAREPQQNPVLVFSIILTLELVCDVPSLLHAHTPAAPSDDRASAPAVPPSSRAVPSFGMTTLDILAAPRLLPFNISILGGGKLLQPP